MSIPERKHIDGAFLHMEEIVGRAVHECLDKLLPGMSPDQMMNMLSIVLARNAGYVVNTRVRHQSMDEIQRLALVAILATQVSIASVAKAPSDRQPFSFDWKSLLDATSRKD